MDIFFLDDKVDRVRNFGPGRLRLGLWTNRATTVWLSQDEVYATQIVSNVFLYPDDPKLEGEVRRKSMRRQPAPVVLKFTNPPTEAGWVVKLLAPEKNEYLRVLTPPWDGKLKTQWTLVEAMALAKMLTSLAHVPTVRVENVETGKYVMP